MINITTRQAVEVICKDLREDEGYYIAWKANIAMAFEDEFYRTYPENQLAEIHNIANNAADYFLKLLMS